MKADHQVQKLYTRRASFYQRFFVDFLGWGRELEKFFRGSNYVRPHIKILDAGCGTGAVTKALYHLAQENKHQGIQFHAFDLTQGMLEILQEWISWQGTNEIELQQADVLAIQSLPSHWKEYDLIVSSTMIEYLPGDKIKGALSNLKYLLGSHGMLLLFITKRNFLTQWLARRWWKTKNYTKQEIQMLLHDAGFLEIDFKNFSPGWSGSIIVVEAK